MATRQAQRRPAGRHTAANPSTTRRRRRYAVVYDIEGPRVRLGMLWFLVAGLAVAIGPLATAVVYGGAAAVAAAQVARVWRR
jgi:hypothetical protein